MIRIPKSFNIFLYLFLFLFSLNSLVKASSLPDLVEKLTSSVVRIETTNISKQNLSITGDPFFDEFFRRQFGDDSQPRTSKGLGSGFIYSKNGYVITNFHVIEKANDNNGYKTEVFFDIDFEVKNKFLNILMTKSFQYGLEKIADAFQKRAESL